MSSTRALPVPSAAPARGSVPMPDEGAPDDGGALDEPHTPLARAGAWRQLVTARWSASTAAGVAVLLLLTVVAVVLVLRASTTADALSRSASTAGTKVAVPARSEGAAAADPPVATGAAGATGAVGAVGAVGSTAPPATAAPVVVDVVGHVASPGLQRLPAGARVDDAVRAAGGPDPTADLGLVNLARPLVDGEQVVVPAPGGAPSSAAAAGTLPAPSGPGPAAAAGAATPATKVSLRTATPAQLDELPGVGPVLAARIVAYRAAHGPFTSVDQLGDVSGIGDVVLGRLRPLVVL